MHIDPNTSGLSPLASPVDNRSLAERPEVRPIPPVQPVSRDLAGSAENKVRSAADAPERRRPSASDGHTTDTQDRENNGSQDGHIIDVYA